METTVLSRLASVNSVYHQKHKFNRPPTSTPGVVSPIATDAGEAFPAQRHHTDKEQIFARTVRSLYAQLPSLARCAASTDAMFSAISTAENSPDLYADLMNLPHRK
ncbi:hypothetical protein LTR56_015452 [Elasticomyces elasticus]|nr:hypothetical protein LTR22_022652 [Elasticomyces elasticus]KAK3634106.1 hypothetical protein LTR56_015452 [Elasticomyces elasticus]KAK4909975.1 hypothetical protein LTR49_021317 [Elasticomyces elasticus]KAK5754878.1 hypothetical protein LTS12_015001 [Elasticomyces elasticus]